MSQNRSQHKPGYRLRVQVTGNRLLRKRECGFTLYDNQALGIASLCLP